MYGHSEVAPPPESPIRDQGDARFSVGYWPIVLAAVLGLTVGPVMALPAEVLSPQSRNTGIGLYYSIYYLGTGCLPALAGRILNTTGSVAAVIWFSAICLLLAPLSLLALRLMQTRWRLDAAVEPA